MQPQFIFGKKTLQDTIRPAQPRTVRLNQPLRDQIKPSLSAPTNAAQPFSILQPDPSKERTSTVSFTTFPNLPHF